MKFAQLTGHYIRLKQKIATTYHAPPWHGDHIHRLANDLASIELQLSAVSHGNKLCREHHALGRARQSIGMSMQASSTNEILISAESQPVFARGPARQCVVIDRSGRRVVLPRYSAAKAVEQIAMAIAGRAASSEEKRQAWEHLQDQQDFAVEWLQVKPVNSPHHSCAESR